MKEAATVGFEILRADGNTLHAVEAAAVCIEDNEVARAGLKGHMEPDAHFQWFRLVNGESSHGITCWTLTKSQ